MKYIALTDRGILRKKNEDAYLIKNRLFGVADGMGGHKAGGVASRIALEFIEKKFTESFLSKTTANNLLNFLVQSIKEANQFVFGESLESAEQYGMGTTLTLLLFNKENYFIGHIGDSRAYLLRENKLTQLTEDHSLVADLIRKNYISKKEAEFFPYRNIITKALGTNAEIEPSVSFGKTEKKDRFLLCTDGLTEMLKDKEIKQIIASERSLNIASEKLIALANQRGGRDNITLVLIEI
ncbi:MAG: Stp1/IreP family PP2C-type Ser/Thr phosphatase [Actinobacteria bacterium]|nr:Stp1/IreP family PP2C-type Ser/Thr phosphatase [Actinomycetota bacterium]